MISWAIEGRVRGWIDRLTDFRNTGKQLVIHLIVVAVYELYQAVHGI
jgi:hypothetical protein